MTDFEEKYDELLDEFYELKSEYKTLITEFLEDLKSAKYGSSCFNNICRIQEKWEKERDGE